MRSGSPTMLIVAQGNYTAMQREAILGAHVCVRAHGWTAISERGSVRRIPTWLRTWQPRAALILFGTPEAVECAAALAPTVAAMSYFGGVAVPSIDMDQAAVGQMAAEHLLGRDLRHFAVLGDWKFQWATDRARAFERCIVDAGFSCRLGLDLDLKQDTTGAVSMSRTKFRRRIQSSPKPLGILTCTDRIGMLVIDLCQSAQVRVPDDVAVVSVGNDDVLCEMCDPPLSSIATNWQQIGYDAAMLAAKLAAGEPVEPTRRLVRPAGMVSRRSSDPLAIDDPDVAAALRVIHDHADRILSVRDLLGKIPVHRNRLERRFRDLVGRRILQEVKRVHVEQAKRLLASSDLAMSDVAERSGFANASTLSIAFRSATGQTPTQFRGQFRLQK